MKKIFAGILLVFLLPSGAFAQEKPFSVEQKEFLIQTSAAKTLTESILVRSFSSAITTISATWRGYDISDEESVNELSISQHSIDFSTLDSTKLTIQPQSTQVIGVTFTLPANIKAGDYYGSLILESGETVETVKFTVRVLGTFTEKIILKAIEKHGNEFLLKVANEGNRTTNVSSLVKISDFVGEIDQAKSETTSLQAGKITSLVVKHKNLLPGFYQANLGITYGEKSITNTTVFSFWVWPWFFIFTGTAVVAIVAFIVFWEKHKNG